MRLRDLAILTLLLSLSLNLSAEEPRRVPKLTKPGGLFPGETITLDEVMGIKNKRERILILDARSKRSYDQAHVAGAVLPLTPGYYAEEALFLESVVKDPPDQDKALAEAMKKYPKGLPIVTYCSDDCHASAVLLFKIKKLGFTNVKAMEQGFQSWQSKGYPVVSGEKKAGPA